MAFFSCLFGSVHVQKAGDLAEQCSCTHYQHRVLLLWASQRFHPSSCTRGLTINLTLRFLRLWVEPGVPREKQHKCRKNMHKEKALKPEIRSANHCTLCQFCYYSFFFFFYSLQQLCLTGPHSWGSPHQKPLMAATVFYCCSWTIESF